MLIAFPLKLNAALTFESFARLPDVSQLKLSPDGKHIASIVRYELDSLNKGVLVHLFNVDSKKKTLLMKTNNKRFKLNWLKWANNDTLLVSARYPSRVFGTATVSTRLLKIDIETGDNGNAIPSSFLRKQSFVPIIQDSIVDILPNDPDHILVALRTSREPGTAVYRINLSKNRAKRIQHAKSYVFDWFTDRQNNLRGSLYFKDTTIKISSRQDDSKKWRELFQYESISDDAKQILGFGHNPNTLFYLAYDQGKQAVFKADISQKPLKPELVYAHPEYDVSGSLIYSPTQKKVVGITNSVGYGFHFWDQSYKAMQNGLNKALPDTDNKILSISMNERRAIVGASSDADAGAYYIWDRDKKTLDAIALKYSDLDPELMSKKQSISYEARDGLTINGYLTRPNNNNDEAGPTIVFPHGGPISYDGRGFDYWTQFFAHKGYNVLQMNFRGSSGYCFDFMKSGLQEWGGKMQTDVEDGTRWLIDQGIADPEKICVVGASYGGYAALMEAKADSGLYQCAVSFAGVTDLPYLLSSARRFVSAKTVEKMIGKNRKRLKERSPVNNTQDLNIPVLLAHGTKDRRVLIAHGRKMSKQLKKAGKNVKYIELKDGDHFLSNEKHRLEFFKAMDIFLSRYLD